MPDSDHDTIVEKLAAECEAARLAVGEVVNANRISGDMDKIKAALERWRLAKKALRRAKEAARRVPGV